MAHSWKTPPLNREGTYLAGSVRFGRPCFRNSLGKSGSGGLVALVR